MVTQTLRKFFSGNGIAQQGDLAAAKAKLEKAVKDSLDQDEELKKADLQVTADVTKNKVTLVGTVGSQAVHDKALGLTKTAHVGVIIEDKISVRPRRRRTASSSRYFAVRSAS